MVKKESKYEKLVREVNIVLNSYSGKMTLRQVYYRLVSKHIIPNTINEYKGLSRHLVKARERGRVPWYRIEDRGRTVSGGDYGYSEAPDPKAHVKKKLQNVFRNSLISFQRWLNQPERIEVWIEKEALSRLASKIADRYNVRVCPSKGYSSFTYIKQAVNRLNKYDEPVTILYFGDYDPSGFDIERDMEERLRAYGAYNLKTVKRICLNREQIDRHELPPFPAKTSDVRYTKFVAETGSDDTVELDAIPPQILEEYIAEAIEDHIDSTIWDETEEAEEEANEAIKEVLESVRSMFADVEAELEEEE